MSKRFPLFAEIVAVDKMTAVVRRVAANFRPLIDSARRVNRAWGGVTAAGARFAGQLRTLAFGVTAAAGAGLFAARRSAAAASTIVDAADKLGIGVERYQALAYAADQAGVAQQNFETGLQRLNRRIVDAASGGNKNLAAFFDKAGISLRRANGEFRTSAELLPELAEVFKANAGNEALLNNMAFALWDSEGVDMLRMMMGGAEGLQHMIEEAMRFGVASEESVRAAAAWDGQMDSLGTTIKATAMAITGSLAPALGAGTTSFQELLVAARPEILAKATQAFGYMTDALFGVAREAHRSGRTIREGGLIEGFRQVAAVALPVGRTLLELLGGWEGAAKAVAAVFAAKLLVSAAGLALALGNLVIAVGGLVIGLGGSLVTAAAAAGGALKTLGLLMLANPVTATALLIAGAAALIITNWDSLAPFFEKLWGKLASGVAWVKDALTAPFTAAMDAVRDAVGAAVDWMLGKLRGLLSWLPDSLVAKLGIDLSGIGATAAGLAGVQGAAAGAPPDWAAAGDSARHDPGRQRVTTEVVIRGENLPRGLRIEEGRSSADRVDMDLGYSTAGTAP